jgi:hypothetical protein
MTMIWKEWKEVLVQRGSSRSGVFGILIILGLLGVLMPLQTGPEWVEQPRAGAGVVVASNFPGNQYGCGCICR